MLKSFFILEFKILSTLYISFYTSLAWVSDIAVKEFKLAILGLNPNYYTLT